MEQIHQVQSHINGTHNGNRGDYNVYGNNNNIIWNISMSPNMAYPGGANETRALGGRDGAPTKANRPCWMVPYCRNNAFTGRRSTLESIAELCGSGGHNRLAIHGLGGSGKTQLALEYVYQRAGKSDCHVFWVPGSGVLKFRDGFRAIAHDVGIPLVGTDNDNEGHLRCVRRWFEGPNSGDWILVIDNADNDADFIDNTNSIAKFVPQGPRGTVVFTTRSKQVAVRQGCRIIEVGKMADEEALELFAKRFGSWDTLEDEEKRVVATILDSVGNLPLAIAGVAAFMAENGTSPSAYWNILHENDDRTKALLTNQFRDIQREADTTESILGTYFITFDRIKEQMPPAAELLRVIAFLDRQNIPQQLLTHSGLEGMDDSLRFCEAIGKLLRFALVSEVKQEGTVFYELHRLVQLSMQVYLPTEEAKQGKAIALGAVSRLLPEYEYKRRHICAAYMSHALVLTKDSTDPITEELAYRMGCHFMEMGSYNNAEIQAHRCIALREADEASDWMGEHCSRIMLAGMASRNLGREKEAEVMYRRALQGYEKALGSDDPHTLWAIGNLAIALERQGRYEESEVMNRRILEGYEKALGSNHPNTLTAMGNLAIVLERQGRYEESEAMNRRALEGYEQSLGSDHPTTLWAVANLAIVLEREGRYEESEAMNRRALQGREKALGSDHPETLWAVGKLAIVLEGQGRYEESEVMKRRVLEGYEKDLGSDNPKTLSAMGNLAIVLEGQGKYEESEVMKRRVLEGYEKVLGSDHLDTLLAVNNLAIVLECQGRYEESVPMNRRVLEGYEKALGSDHPRTLTAAHNLTRLLWIQERCKESGCKPAQGRGRRKLRLSDLHLAVRRFWTTGGHR